MAQAPRDSAARAGMGAAARKWRPWRLAGIGLLVLVASVGLAAVQPRPSETESPSASDGASPPTGIGPSAAPPTPRGSSASGTRATVAPGDPVSPPPTPDSPDSQAPFLSVDDLRDRAARARAGEEPYASAVDDLLRSAERALDREPEPVDPLVIRGQSGTFSRDGTRAYGMALAYVVTGDERFAEGAARNINAWVAETGSAEDVCPDSGACHTSLILGRNAPSYVFAAELIDGSDAFPEASARAFAEWLRRVILPNASERPTNWGDAGNFSRAAVANYIGDDAAFDRTVDLWRDFLDMVTAEGQIPEETRRGRDGLLYSQEALQYKIGVAVIAERRGLDVWSYVGAQGGSLRTAVDLVARYWKEPDGWPWHDRVRVPSAGPFWEIVYARWRDPGHVPLVEDTRPYGDRGHSALRWTTLTHGIPIESDGTTP